MAPDAGGLGEESKPTAHPQPGKSTAQGDPRVAHAACPGAPHFLTGGPRFSRVGSLGGKATGRAADSGEQVLQGFVLPAAPAGGEPRGVLGSHGGPTGSVPLNPCLSEEEGGPGPLSHTQLPPPEGPSRQQELRTKRTSSVFIGQLQAPSQEDTARSLAGGRTWPEAQTGATHRREQRTRRQVHGGRCTTDRVVC